MSRSPRRPLPEEAVADGWLALTARGQIFGFGALTLILATIITLAVLGQPWLAGVVATSSLFDVVGIFVTGRFDSRRDGSPEPDSAEPVKQSCMSTNGHRAPPKNIYDGQ